MKELKLIAFIIISIICISAIYVLVEEMGGTGMGPAANGAAFLILLILLVVFFLGILILIILIKSPRLYTYVFIVLIAIAFLYKGIQLILNGS